MKNITLEQVLDRMYSAELNCRISNFWDAGWDVWLGDETNGWKEKGWVDTAAEIGPALHAMIDRHYPGAMLAPISCPNCQADHSERGAMAAEITCHCGFEFLVNHDH